MICPKCGHKNADTAHECERCGIFFIRWMIQQYRSQGETAPPAARASRAAGRSIPLLFSRSALAAVALGAVALGFAAGRLSPRTPPQAWESASPLRLSEAELLGLAAPVLKEAAERGTSLGVALTPAVLLPFVEQGLNEFNLENLKAAAAAAGKAVPTLTAEADDGHAHRDTPFRCLMEGAWTYFAAPPAVQAGAVECWAMEREPRRDGAVRWSAVFWEKLTWVPEKGRWALFSRADEREWFRRHIETRLGAEAEQADLAESEKLLREAGADPGKRLSAAAAAYRTRLRREGALCRLRRLGTP